MTWEQPFHFLFATLSSGGQLGGQPGALDFFFRVARVLMEEVVAYDQSRSKSEIARNVEVKRAMRSNGVFTKIVGVFIHVMSSGGEKKMHRAWLPLRKWTDLDARCKIIY